MKHLLICIFISLIVMGPLVAFSLTGDSEVETGKYTGAGSAGLSTASRIDSGYILLVKGDKFVVGNTCLDYKGLHKKSVLIDLYLLDFDSEQPYPKKFDKNELDEQIRLGDNVYEVVVAKQGYMKLRLVKNYSTL